MSEKELSQYYWLKQEVKQLEDRILEFGDGVGAIKYKDIISTHGTSLSIQEKKSELISKLIEARLSALEKYLEIERYIETIEDSEIRQIMRYRFLDLFDWFKIGELLNCDRTTASKKLRTYLKLSLLSHTK